MHFGLYKKLKQHGFDHAAKALASGDMSFPLIEQARGRVKLFETWEKFDKWPWPQWDKKSIKDWYALRDQCEFECPW